MHVQGKPVAATAAAATAATAAATAAAPATAAAAVGVGAYAVASTFYRSTLQLVLQLVLLLLSKAMTSTLGNALVCPSPRMILLYEPVCRGTDVLYHPVLCLFGPCRRELMHMPASRVSQWWRQLLLRLTREEREHVACRRGCRVWWHWRYCTQKILVTSRAETNKRGVTSMNMTI